MKKTKWLFVSLMISVVAIFLMLSPYRLSSQQGAVVRVDGDDVGGVVTGVNGPEAGVWVIAETTDLPTKFAKIVVTDDQGRYLLPDLPKGNYDVWVRGYGLVDSPKVKAAPGKALNLTAVAAPDTITVRSTTFCSPEIEAAIECYEGHRESRPGPT